MNEEKKQEYMDIIETIIAAVDRHAPGVFKPFSIAVMTRALELYEQYIKIFGITTPEDVALYEEIF